MPVEISLAGVLAYIIPFFVQTRLQSAHDTDFIVDSPAQGMLDVFMHTAIHNLRMADLNSVYIEIINLVEEYDL